MNSDSKPTPDPVELLFRNDREQFFSALDDWVWCVCKTHFYRFGGESSGLSLEEVYQDAWAIISTEKWHELRRTFIEVNAGEIEERVPLRPYLVAIIRNNCIKTPLRKKRRGRHLWKQYPRITPPDGDEADSYESHIPDPAPDCPGDFKYLSEKLSSKSRARLARLARRYETREELENGINALSGVGDRAILKLDLRGEYGVDFALTDEEMAYRLFSPYPEARTTGEVAARLLVAQADDREFAFSVRWVEDAYGIPSAVKGGNKYSQYRSRAYQRLCRPKDE